jgi:hypothetical protein
MIETSNVTNYKEIRVSLPTLTFRVPSLKDSLKNISSYLYDLGAASFEETKSRAKRFSGFNLFSPWNNLSKGKKRALLGIIAIIAILYYGFPKFKNLLSTGSSQVASATTESVEVNRDFGIPLKDAKGEETGEQVKLVVSKVDKTPTIIIKGQRANAVAGRWKDFPRRQP